MSRASSYLLAALLGKNQNYKFKMSTELLQVTVNASLSHSLEAAIDNLLNPM